MILFRKYKKEIRDLEWRIRDLECKREMLQRELDDIKSLTEEEPKTYYVKTAQDKFIYVVTDVRRYRWCNGWIEMIGENGELLGEFKDTCAIWCREEG